MLYGVVKIYSDVCDKSTVSIFRVNNLFQLDAFFKNASGKLYSYKQAVLLHEGKFLSLSNTCYVTLVEK